MSQNTVVLPTTGTVSGLQMTQATNNALDTLNTLASGASAPSSAQAGQLWHDTSTNILKLRSLDNTSWIALLNLNESAYVAAPAIAVGSYGNVNRIINGGMAIDQVNEGAAYSVPTNNTYTYSADQWITACLSSTASGVTAQRVADAPAGFTNSLKLTVGTGASSVAASDYFACWQPIEANNIYDLNWGTANAGSISISFWVKASIAGTYAVSLQNNNGTRACINKFTITSSGVWQFITIPNIPCDSSGTWAAGNNACLNVFFMVATGSTFQTGTLNAWVGGAYMGSTSQSNGILTTSGATFQVTGVMLNAGVFNLPFERRSIQQELMLCQRYYEKTFTTGLAVGQNAGVATGDIFMLSCNAANNVNYYSWHYSTRKRTAPTLVTYNVSAANSQWRDTTTSTDKTAISLGTTEWNAGIYVNTATSVGDNLRIHATANARM